MRIVYITLGLLVMGFSVAAGDDFVNFSPRNQPPFFPSKGLLLGGSYVNINDDSNFLLEKHNFSEVVESYLGERARQAVVGKGLYVRVTYRKDNGESETVEGFVQAMDATELTIYRGVWEKKILKNRISALMILYHPSQLSRSKYAPYTWILTGAFGGVIGWSIGWAIVDCEGESPICAVGYLVYPPIGMLIGTVTGIVVGLKIFRDQKRYGQFGVALKGGLMGLGTGTVMTMATNRKLWPSMLIGPVVGAAIMSRWSHDTLEPRRFSVDVVHNREGNLSAVATLRF